MASNKGKQPRAISYGNRTDIINVKLQNGEVVTAIAGNCINTSKVFVVKQGGEYYVWGNTPPKTVFSSRTLGRHTPEPDVEEAEILLPFQVLFTFPVSLGGDRQPVTLSNFSPVNIGGVNNLGNQEYYLVWLQAQIVQDLNQVQTFLDAPDIFQIVEPTWIGNGILRAEFLQDFPEENLTKELLTSEDLGTLDLPELDGFDLNLPDEAFGASDLPLDFAAPLYLRFDERTRYALRTGVILNTQEDEGYKLTRLESYTYQNEVSPDSTPSPVAAIFDINLVCNFTTSGIITTTKYERNAQVDYTLSERETFSTTSQNWLNGQLNSGDRSYDRKKSVNYTVTPSFFSNEVDFRCENLTPSFPIFGFYNWEPVTSFSLALYSGEINTYAESETTEINEEWIKNISLNFTRTQKQVLTENFTRSETYVVQSNNWQVQVFNFGFLFPSEGSLLISQSRNTQDEIVTPTSKLISGDGNAVLFTEIESTLNRNITVDRERSVDKLSALNANGDFVEISFVTTTQVTQAYSDEFYLAIGDTLTEIETDESWMFSVTYENGIPILGEGTFTFSNTLVDTGGNVTSPPIFEGSLANITAYTKTDTKFDFQNFPNQLISDEIGVVFTEVEKTEYAYWSNINGSSVYIFSQGFRYLGIVLGFEFEDNPNEELPIDIIRSVSSITILITSVESYPVGLAEENEILIALASNLSVLVRDRVLNDQNKVHANLVDNVIYFSKSIIFDPSQPEQFAEVYDISGVITQAEPQAGQFIPVTNSQDIISTSYFPIE